MSSIFFQRERIRKVSSVMLGTFAFFLVTYTQVKMKPMHSMQRVLIAPPPQLERFSFGYQESIADVLWIRALQDFDYCDQPIGKNLCRNNSWLGQVLDTATNLSPKFRIVYAAGGLALTVLISDIEGATTIYDKGVREFPNDWPILYRAAYHYLYEVKDKARAAELLNAAAKNGAPDWTYTLAGRLYSEAGEMDLAEAVLKEMIESKQDEHIINRLRQKIDDMKSKRIGK